MKPTMNDPIRSKEFFQQKLSFTTGPMEVRNWIEDGEDVRVIDVRAAKDYAAGHVPGAISLPEDRWDSAEGLDPDGVNVVYCYTQVCHLAARAARFFAEKGFSVMEMDGGMKAWREYEFDVETESADPKMKDGGAKIAKSKKGKAAPTKGVRASTTRH